MPSDPSPRGAELALPLSAAVEAIGRARPDDDEDAQDDKKNYAQALSAALASMFARRLRVLFPMARVTPREDNTGHEYRLGADIDRKKTDVGVWDDAAGLILGISIKTYSFRDYTRAKDGKSASVAGYRKNVLRNDLELRAEAAVLHRRQPFAFLVAVIFTPRAACWDSKTKAGKSSFAQMVFTFRKRIRRTSVDSPHDDLFEAAYIGIYTPDGAVEFFDVELPPRRNQPPPGTDTLSFDELIDHVRRLVLVRNEGVAPEDRYRDDEPGWTPPALPDSFDEDDDENLERDDELDS